MTIIAYKDGVIAADTQTSAGGTIEGHVIKIARNSQGDLAGWCGEAVYGYAFLQWFMADHGGTLPDATKTGDPTNTNRAMIVRRDGRVEIYEHKGFSIQEPGYMAMGSGRDIAFGAMFMGATAVRAVEAAIAHDTTCGGRVVSLRHDP